MQRCRDLEQLEARLTCLERVEATHHSKLTSHVHNLHAEIVDCEMLLTAAGLPDRSGARDGPLVPCASRLDDLAGEVEAHSSTLGALTDHLRQLQESFRAQQASLAEAEAERRGLASELYHLRADLGEAGTGDLLCQLAKDVFSTIPAALAGHELLIAEATAQAATVAGGFRPIAAADLLGRMLSCESKVQQVLSLAVQLPEMDKALHDLQDRVVSDLTLAAGRLSAVECRSDRLLVRATAVEAGLSVASSRLGTVNVAKLGEAHVALTGASDTMRRDLSLLQAAQQEMTDVLSTLAAAPPCVEASPPPGVDAVTAARIAPHLVLLFVPRLVQHLMPVLCSSIQEGLAPVFARLCSLEAATAAGEPVAPGRALEEDSDMPIYDDGQGSSGDDDINWM